MGDSVTPKRGYMIRVQPTYSQAVLRVFERAGWELSKPKALTLQRIRQLHPSACETSWALSLDDDARFILLAWSGADTWRDGVYAMEGRILYQDENPLFNVNPEEWTQL